MCFNKIMWWLGCCSDVCADRVMLLFIFTLVNILKVVWGILLFFFFEKLLLGSYRRHCLLTEQQMLFHFNSEKKFTTCSVLITEAPSTKLLGRILWGW